MGSWLQAFSGELKRRNVLRIAAAYLVAGWVALQIVDILGPGLRLPDWAVVAVAIVILVGLPIALLVAWYFEITPSGFVPTHQVPAEQSITHSTGRRIDRLIIALLAIALAFFVGDALLRRVLGDARPIPRQGYDSLAVLPQPDVERVQRIAGQLAREIASVLETVPNLTVTPMEVVENLRETAPESAASELGVHYLLLFDNTDSKLSQIGIRLYDAVGDETIWETSVLPSEQNALALESTIAREVAKRLGVLTAAEAETLLSPPTQNSAAYAHYLRGRLLASGDSQDLAEIEQEFKKSIGLDDRFALPYAGLCKLFILRYEISNDSKDFQQAEGSCHRSLTLGRYRGAVDEALGDLYLASGQARRAEESYQAAMQVNPSSISAILGFGRSLQRQGYFERAASVYKEAINAQPSYSRAYNALAVNYYQRSEYDKAFEQLELATTLAPQSPLIINNHAALYMMLGRFDVTISLLEPVATEQDATVSQVSNLGTAYYFAGAFSKAAEQYKRAIKLAPKSAILHRNLGDAYVALRERDFANEAFKEAVGLSIEALRINPNDPDALTSAAVGYASMGNYEEFQVLERKLLGLAETVPNVAYDLAVSYCRLGLIDDCLHQVELSSRNGYSRAIIESEPALKQALVQQGKDSEP